MGLVGKVSDSLKAAGFAVDAFTETEGNPSTDTVEKAAAAYKASGADFIVAFGGGSPMDVAKAVGVVAKYGGRIEEYEARTRFRARSCRSSPSRPRQAPARRSRRSRSSPTTGATTS